VAPKTVSFTSFMSQKSYSSVEKGGTKKAKQIKNKWIFGCKWVWYKGYPMSGVGSTVYIE
jgi:hypothetical protein